MSQPILAATLAVGTEVVDGQIIDRNSAWISHKVTEVGFKVIEHRAVADDRPDIERALRELSERVDYLFVTGGLGPTSDDFTRDLIASVYGRPLEFDEASWRHLSELLTSRGMEVREIQKQQCYFPKGAKVLTNPAGTANAFEILEARAGTSSKAVHLVALPGPPTEIAAVWELNLEERMSQLVPKDDREELLIIRCLGRGESQIAEIVEDVIKGHDLRVGYRAHLPYIEVKLWYPVSQKSKAAPVISEIEKRLAIWIVNRNDEDLVDHLLEKAKDQQLYVTDAASGGLLADRITQKIQSTKASCQLVVQTVFGALPPRLATGHGMQILIEMLETENKWRISVQNAAGPKTVLVESPPFNYKVGSDRGRKYIVEKALQKLTEII